MDLISTLGIIVLASIIVIIIFLVKLVSTLIQGKERIYENKETRLLGIIVLVLIIFFLIIRILFSKVTF